MPSFCVTITLQKIIEINLSDRFAKNYTDVCWRNEIKCVILQLKLQSLTMYVKICKLNDSADGSN